MPAPGLLRPSPPVQASLCTLRCPACKCQAKTQTGAWHEKCKHSPPTATHMIKPPSFFLPRRRGCFLAHQMEATYVTSRTADKNENSNIQSLLILINRVSIFSLLNSLFIHRCPTQSFGAIYWPYHWQAMFIPCKFYIVSMPIYYLSEAGYCPPQIVQFWFLRHVSTLVHPSASRRPLSNHITHPFHPSSHNFWKWENMKLYVLFWKTE